MASREKSIISQILDSLDTQQGKYCQVIHKRGWLEYIKSGQLVFSPNKMHRVLREVIDADGNRPRGESLFLLRECHKFTLMPDKLPMRTEEALERFIVVSNDDNFYDQVPIGGGKESIDIGIGEDKEFTFVELKPWHSSNSPLYALLESLKNLIEYRIIIEKKISQVHEYDKINLCILAPDTYYVDYGLLSKDGTPQESKLEIVRQLLNDLADEFDTQITFKSLSFDQQNFNKYCNCLYDKNGFIGQEIVEISKDDAMESLRYFNWNLLVSS